MGGASRSARPRIAPLNTQCKEALASIPKVKVLTPRDPALSEGIICFKIASQTPDEMVHRLLAHKVIASTSPYKISYPRLARFTALARFALRALNLQHAGSLPRPSSAHYLWRRSCSWVLRLPDSP